MIESFLSSHLVWFWLILAIGFGIVEIMTLGVVSIWFAIGALVTMLFAFVTDNFLIQLIIFLVVSLLLVFTTRKFAINYLKIGTQKTNLDSLIGKIAIVTQDIQPYDAGEIKIDGKLWRAISQTQQPYLKGEQVEVLKIEGVTIILK